MALAPLFLRFACAGEPAAMLDLGCGTGSLIRAADRTCSRAWLVGMDPAPDYLAHARTAVAPGRAGFVAGLVERLPFADGAFDCCLSLLLLQEIRDRGRALREMHRSPAVAGTRPPASGTSRHADARGDPRGARCGASRVLERNGRQGATAFASEAELRQHWDAAGLADVETTSLLARVLYPSFDDLWQSLLSGSTPVSAAVAALPSSARAEVHDQLLAQLAGGSDSGSFELESKAFAVRGRAVRQTHRARGAEARSR